MFARLWATIRGTAPVTLDALNEAWLETLDKTFDANARKVGATRTFLVDLRAGHRPSDADLDALIAACDHDLAQTARYRRAFRRAIDTGDLRVLDEVTS